MESKRLIIRESSFEDCEHFAKWEKTEAVNEFLSIDETRSYEEIVREFVLNGADPHKLQYTIIAKEDVRPIGRVYITSLNRKADSLDITRIYIGDISDRGRGYGREAVELLLGHCFEKLSMERVTLDYYLGNKTAAELYKKIGFSKEGIARHGCKKNGKYYDLQIMSILRDEFLQD